MTLNDILLINCGKEMYLVLYLTTVVKLVFLLLVSIEVDREGPKHFGKGTLACFNSFMIIRPTLNCAIANVQRLQDHFI